ncbi:cytoplasmic dynein 2 intermediate chain 2-like [Haemaphysalis longicornis]
MFSTELVQYDEFPPSGKELRNMSHSCVQTEPQATTEIGTQGRECCHVEVQASPKAVAALEPRAYDWPSLAAFMRRAYPTMKEELEKSSRSSAFRGHRLLADTCEGTPSRLYRDTRFPQEFHCTDASWNSTGSILALSYPFAFRGRASLCGESYNEQKFVLLSLKPKYAINKTCSNSTALKRICFGKSP